MVGRLARLLSDQIDYKWRGQLPLANFSTRKPHVLLSHAPPLPDTPCLDTVLEGLDVIYETPYIFCSLHANLGTMMQDHMKKGDQCFF